MNEGETSKNHNKEFKSIWNLMLAAVNGKTIAAISFIFLDACDLGVVQKICAKKFDHSQ